MRVPILNVLAATVIAILQACGGTLDDGAAAAGDAGTIPIIDAGPLARRDGGRPDGSTPSPACDDGTAPCPTGTLYFTDVEPISMIGSVKRIALPSSGEPTVEVVVADQYRTGGLALHPWEPILYWTKMGDEMYFEPGRGSIYRAELNRIDAASEILSGLDAPYALEVDADHGTLYWTASDQIGSASLDGARPTTWSVPDVYGDLALSNGLFYWTTSGTTLAGEIRRAADAGAAGHSDVIVTGFGKPLDLAIDTATDTIYWTDFVEDRIGRANLDGSAVEEVMDSPDPHSIAVDVAGRRLFWSEEVSTNHQRIMQMNLETRETSVLSNAPVDAVGQLVFVPPGL